MSGSLYAVYNGDELVDVGAVESFVERLGVKAGTMRYLATPSAHRRGHRTLAYRVEEGEPL